MEVIWDLTKQSYVLIRRKFLSFLLAFTLGTSIYLLLGVQLVKVALTTMSAAIALFLGVVIIIIHICYQAYISISYIYITIFHSSKNAILVPYLFIKRYFCKVTSINLLCHVIQGVTLSIMLLLLEIMKLNSNQHSAMNFVIVAVFMVLFFSMLLFSVFADIIVIIQGQPILRSLLYSIMFVLEHLKVISIFLLLMMGMYLLAICTMHFWYFIAAFLYIIYKVWVTLFYLKYDSSALEKLATIAAKKEAKM